MSEKVRVVHSETKNAWNIVGTILGGKYKWARIPYEQYKGNESLSTKEKFDALLLAEFIAEQINHGYYDE
jgi:hypothetical protein